MSEVSLLPTERELINNIRDLIYAPGMTSKERAEAILRLVRSSDPQRSRWDMAASGAEYPG